MLNYTFFDQNVSCDSVLLKVIKSSEYTVANILHFNNYSLKKFTSTKLTVNPRFINRVKPCNKKSLKCNFISNSARGRRLFALGRWQYGGDEQIILLCRSVLSTSPYRAPNIYNKQLKKKFIESYKYLMSSKIKFHIFYLISAIIIAKNF